MNKHRKLILAALALAAVAIPITANEVDPVEGYGAGAPVAEPVAAGDLVDVVVDAGGPSHLVVTLVGRGLENHQTFVLENPPRIVVDLHGVVSRLDDHLFQVGESGLTRVRAGQFQREPEPVSRVVFDLNEPLGHQVSLVGSDLVVRLEPAEDPVEAVLARYLPEPAEAEAESPAEELADPTSADGALSDGWISPEPSSEPAGSEVEPVDEWAGTMPPAESAPEEVPAADGARMAEPAEPPSGGERSPPAEPEPATEEPGETRAVGRDTLERFLQAPAFAAPHPEASGEATAAGYETRKIVTETTQYTGKRISLNLVDADIKQVFRLFHEISGLNFVLHPTVDGRVTIVLDNVPWDQALDLILKNNGLDKVLEDNVIRIAPTQQLAAEAAQRRSLKEAKELEVEPVTITRTLSYAKAKDAERVIREGGILSPRGKVIVDERTNTLIISDIPKRVAPIDQLISNLDTETPQVMIEARIVETSREFTQDFGVVWGFEAIADASKGTATGLGFPHNVNTKYDLNLPGEGAASTLAFSLSNVIDSFTLDIALNALEQEGRGRILSSPKIATQNNERAEIEQGIRIPVVNTTATEINVEYVSASLRMNVTPQITAEGTIILDVTVENNTPDFVNRVGDVPPINTQRAQTKVLINDGGTTVIGGIFTVNEGLSETGVPWFRKIPVFGWLFKSRAITNENRELLIFITPRIMKLS